MLKNKCWRIILTPSSVPGKTPGRMKFMLLNLHVHQLAIVNVYRDFYSRMKLDEYLSRALDVDLEDGRLTAIDDSAYVLTLDYAIKMLDIHERFKCGVPVIIEGETGVGKTALVEMLSRLWNQSLLLEWRKQRSRLLDFIDNKLRASGSDDYEVGPV